MPDGASAFAFANADGASLMDNSLAFVKKVHAEVCEQLESAALLAASRLEEVVRLNDRVRECGDLERERDEARDALSKATAMLADAERLSQQRYNRIEDLEEDARQMRKVSNLVVLEKKLAELQQENEVLRRSLSNARTCSAASVGARKASVTAPPPPPPPKDEAETDDVVVVVPVPSPAEDVVPDPEPAASPAQAEIPEETGGEALDQAPSLKPKTIKGQKYLASSDALYAVDADGRQGDRVADLSKDARGRTKIVWL